MKYASAISYPEGAEAPIIVCTGKGKTAERILEIAQEENIPVFHNKNLANVLSSYEIDSFVPKETWSVLAGIFAYIQKVENNENKK